MAAWSVQEAKNRFSALVEAAQQEPQTVTKHGKPAVVVLDAAEYDRLTRCDRLHRPSFVDHLLSMPKDDREFERSEGRLREVDL